MKLVDDTPLHSSNLEKLVMDFNRYYKLCKRENLDFEDYVDNNELFILVEQLKCCLRNKEKLRR